MTLLLHVTDCSGHLQEGTYQRKEYFWPLCAKTSRRSVTYL